MWLERTFSEVLRVPPTRLGKAALPLHSREQIDLSTDARFRGIGGTYALAVCIGGMQRGLRTSMKV